MFNNGGFVQKINVDVMVDEFIPSNNQTNFLLSMAPDPNKIVTVKVNGQGQLNQSDYTIIGKILHWVSNDFNLTPTDTLVAKYLY